MPDSVDVVVEAVVREIICEEVKKHTVIAIAHRLTKIRLYNCVVVIEDIDWVIVETENPEELLLQVHSVVYSFALCNHHNTNHITGQPQSSVQSVWYKY